MSITDELRKEARGFGCYVYTVEQAEHLTAIADRIDAEHERLMAERRRSCVFYDAERNYCMAYDEGDMADFGWIRLPKDADGEPIHVGDMMERGKARGSVVALMLSKYPKKWGGRLHWGVQLEGEQAPTALDLAFHHHHEPTVEDVLREFVDALDIDRCDDFNATIAEYAAKLRLADRKEQ